MKKLRERSLPSRMHPSINTGKYRILELPFPYLIQTAGRFTYNYEMVFRVNLTSIKIFFREMNCPTVIVHN